MFSGYQPGGLSVLNQLVAFSFNGLICRILILMDPLLYPWIIFLGNEMQIGLFEVVEQLNLSRFYQVVKMARRNFPPNSSKDHSMIQCPMKKLTDFLAQEELEVFQAFKE